MYTLDISVEIAVHAIHLVTHVVVDGRVNTLIHTRTEILHIVSRLFGNSSITYSENITIVTVQCIFILRTRNVSPPRCSCFVLFCFKYTFHDLISHPFFSLIPFFFISKTAKTRMYIYIYNSSSQ